MREGRGGGRAQRDRIFISSIDEFENIIFNPFITIGDFSRQYTYPMLLTIGDFSRPRSPHTQHLIGSIMTSF